MRKIIRFITFFSIILINFSRPLNATTNPPEPIEKAPSRIDDSIIEEIYEAGTYPIILIYETPTGEEINETIYITFYQKRTVENPKENEAIDAYDLELQKGYFNHLTDNDLINMTRARAWSTLDGKSIPIAAVERQVIDQNLGIFRITFRTAQGTETIINVAELENVYMQVGEKYFDYSVNYPLTVSTFISVILMSALLVLFSLNISNILKTTTEVITLLYSKRDNK